MCIISYQTIFYLIFMSFSLVISKQDSKLSSQLQTTQLNLPNQQLQFKVNQIKEFAFEQYGQTYFYDLAFFKQFDKNPCTFNHFNIRTTEIEDSLVVDFSNDHLILEVIITDSENGTGKDLPIVFVLVSSLEIRQYSFKLEQRETNNMKGSQHNKNLDENLFPYDLSLIGSENIKQTIIEQYQLNITDTLETIHIIFNQGINSLFVVEQTYLLLRNLEKDFNYLNEDMFIKVDGYVSTNNFINQAITFENQIILAIQNSGVHIYEILDNHIEVKLLKVLSSNDFNFSSVLSGLNPIQIQYTDNLYVLEKNFGLYSFSLDFYNTTTATINYIIDNQNGQYFSERGGESFVFVNQKGQNESQYLQIFLDKYSNNYYKNNAVQGPQFVGVQIFQDLKVIGYENKIKLTVDGLWTTQSIDKEEIERNLNVDFQKGFNIFKMGLQQEQYYAALSYSNKAIQINAFIIDPPTLVCGPLKQGDNFNLRLQFYSTQCPQDQYDSVFAICDVISQFNVDVSNIYLTDENYELAVGLGVAFGLLFIFIIGLAIYSFKKYKEKQDNLQKEVTNLRQIKYERLKQEKEQKNEQESKSSNNFVEKQKNEDEIKPNQIQFQIE